MAEAGNTINLNDLPTLDEENTGITDTKSIEAKLELLNKMLDFAMKLSAKAEADETEKFNETFNFFKFLKGLGIDFDSLPEFKRSGDRENSNMRISPTEMTAPIMRSDAYSVDSILVAVKGISPMVLDTFEDDPKISDIQGVIQIFDKIYLCKAEADCITIMFHSDMILSAYDYVHNKTGHVGRHVDVCSNCEWFSRYAKLTGISKLLKGEDQVFKVEL